MKSPHSSRFKVPQEKRYRVFRGPDDGHLDDRRRIAVLINVWLNVQYESPPDVPAARSVERELHDAIKGGPLFGKILSFAGLNIWVDGETPEGTVMSQESIVI